MVNGRTRDGAGVAASGVYGRSGASRSLACGNPASLLSRSRLPLPPRTTFWRQRGCYCAQTGWLLRRRAFKTPFRWRCRAGVGLRCTLFHCRGAGGKLRWLQPISLCWSLFTMVPSRTTTRCISLLPCDAGIPCLPLSACYSPSIHIRHLRSHRCSPAYITSGGATMVDVRERVGARLCGGTACLGAGLAGSAGDAFGVGISVCGCSDSLFLSHALHRITATYWRTCFF